MCFEKTKICVLCQGSINVDAGSQCNAALLGHLYTWNTKNCRGRNKAKLLKANIISEKYFKSCLSSLCRVFGWKEKRYSDNLPIPTILSQSSFCLKCSELIRNIDFLKRQICRFKKKLSSDVLALKQSLKENYEVILKLEQEYPSRGPISLTKREIQVPKHSPDQKNKSETTMLHLKYCDIVKALYQELSDPLKTICQNDNDSAKGSSSSKEVNKCFLPDQEYCDLAKLRDSFVENPRLSQSQISYDNSESSNLSENFDVSDSFENHRSATRQKFTDVQKSDNTVMTKFCCSYCPKFFSVEGHKLVHERKTHFNDPSPYHCSHCQNKYTTSRSLRQHIIAYHMENVSSMKCPADGCDKSFLQIENLKRHLRVSHSVKAGHSLFNELNNVIQGSEVLNSFKTNSNTFPFVPEHDLPFPCTLCDRKFGSKKGLLRHKNKIHAETRDLYYCFYCDRKYTELKALLQHKRTCHINSGDPEPFRCPICRKKYMSFDIFKIHLTSFHNHHAKTHSLHKIPKSKILQGSKIYPDTEVSSNDECMDDEASTVTIDRIGSDPNAEELNIEPVFGGSNSSDAPMSSSRCSTSTVNESRYLLLKENREQDREESDKSRPLVSSEVKHFCPQCPRWFVLESHLLIHRRRVHENDPSPYHCSRCDSKYTARRTLLQHVASKHPDMSKMLKCDKCPRVYCQKKSLCKHKKECHSKVPELLCFTCRKGFDDLNDLKNHEALHNRAKEGLHPFQCVICPEIYLNSVDLAEHVTNKHENRYKFKCVECDKTFNNQGSFYLHRKLHKIKEEDKPSCEVCGKRFLTKHMLNNHVTIHSTERKFICEICGKAYRHSRNLRCHRVVHENKPIPDKYKCKICFRGFFGKQKLRNHEETHLKTHNYSCHLCGKTFRASVNLKEHLLRHAGRLKEGKKCKRKLEGSPELVKNVNFEAKEIINEIKLTDVELDDTASYHPIYAAQLAFSSEEKRTDESQVANVSSLDLHTAIAHFNIEGTPVDEKNLVPALTEGQISELYPVIQVSGTEMATYLTGATTFNHLE